MLVHESDIAQRHRDATRVIERVRITRAHRRARIDRDHERQVFLFQKHLEEESIESAIDVPIDESKIVAGRVRTVIREFNALSAAPRTSLTLQLACEDFAAHHIDAIELGHKARVEQIIELAHRLRCFRSRGWIDICHQRALAVALTVDFSSVGVKRTTRRAISSHEIPSDSASKLR